MRLNTTRDYFQPKVKTVIRRAKSNKQLPREIRNRIKQIKDRKKG